VVVSMPQFGAVEYGFVIVAGIIALALALVTRARRRDRRECNEMRTHVRRLGGPPDPSL
jgi:hypothetical protein